MYLTWCCCWCLLLQCGLPKKCDRSDFNNEKSRFICINLHSSHNSSKWYDVTGGRHWFLPISVFIDADGRDLSGHCRVLSDLQTLVFICMEFTAWKIGASSVYDIFWWNVVMWLETKVGQSWKNVLNTYSLSQASRWKSCCVACHPGVGDGGCTVRGCGGWQDRWSGGGTSFAAEKTPRTWPAASHLWGDLTKETRGDMLDPHNDL